MPGGEGDVGVSTAYAVLALGKGEVLILRLGTDMQTDLTVASEVTREQICDIKLLSCFVVASSPDSFDILGANGRSELIKVTFNHGDGQLTNRQVFKADMKV